jgi:hypothetical protein
MAEQDGWIGRVRRLLKMAEEARWEQMLADAEMRISAGKDRVARQRELVADLQRLGKDTRRASKLLRVLEASLAQQVRNRGRLKKELGL